MQGLAPARRRHRPATQSRRLRRIRPGSRQAGPRIRSAHEAGVRGDVQRLRLRRHARGRPHRRSRAGRTTAEQHTIRARAFVDASGEGDLAAFAGAATRYGNDGAVNLGTLATRFGGIPRDVTVTADQLTAAVQAARAAGAGRSARTAACHAPAAVGRHRLLSRLRGLRSARRARARALPNGAAGSRPGPISMSSAACRAAPTPISPRPVPSSARARRATSRRCIG